MNVYFTKSFSCFKYDCRYELKIDDIIHGVCIWQLEYLSTFFLKLSPSDEGQFGGHICHIL